ncbi:response regulator [SAR202 cluster bacterium AC-647-N09_OGT_505m]|nr:response regulator [SAR202 cluster bacterium AC-647-N09_OGT_505m]
MSYWVNAILEWFRCCLCVSDMRWPGTRVLHAKPGEYGIEMTRARSSDIVILDLALQNMDGFDVCVQIQSSSDVHIAMLTVEDTLDETMKGLDLGAGGYLTMPFRSVDFLAMDSTLLRLSHMSHPQDKLILETWKSHRPGCEALLRRAPQ